MTNIVNVTSHWRNVIIVLNARFVPSQRGGAYIYGVVQHALRVADLLRSRGANVGFLLYHRTDGISHPVVEKERVVSDFPGVRFRFHFEMDRSALVRAYRSAVDLVSRGWAEGGDDAPPLLYHQTSVLLPFTPPELDGVVTHHSPFVEDVVAAIGESGAKRAFDWDHPKADLLARMQAEGIAVVANRRNVRCAEISPIQERFLRRRGVPAHRISSLPQPLEGGGDGAVSHEGVAAIEALIARTDAAAAMAGGRRPLVAVTAVSRLDYFKNVELFVEGCCRSLARGDIRNAVVVGGFERDEERDRLTAMIPNEWKDAFLFEPRMPRAALVGALFPRLAGRGVFVCSSRFDLVPYTALEAARTGLCTVAPDNGTVGAASYLPRAYTFAPTADGMAEILHTLASESWALRRFDETALRIRSATSDRAFAAAFEEIGRLLRDEHSAPHSPCSSPSSKTRASRKS